MSTRWFGAKMCQHSADNNNPMQKPRALISPALAQPTWMALLASARHPTSVYRINRGALPPLTRFSARAKQSSLAAADKSHIFLVVFCPCQALSHSSPCFTPRRICSWHEKKPIIP